MGYFLLGVIICLLIMPVLRSKSAKKRRLRDLRRRIEVLVGMREGGVIASERFFSSMIGDLWLVDQNDMLQYASQLGYVPDFVQETINWHRGAKNAAVLLAELRAGHRQSVTQTLEEIKRSILGIGMSMEDLGASDGEIEVFVRQEREWNFLGPMESMLKACQEYRAKGQSIPELFKDPDKITRLLDALDSTWKQLPGVTSVAGPGEGVLSGEISPESVGQYLSTYAEKKVRCISTFDPAPGAKMELEIDREYEVERTNVRNPNHLPLVGLHGLQPHWCFQVLEWRKPEECFPNTKAACQPAPGIPEWGS